MLISDKLVPGSSRWTAKERLKFREAYRTKGKNFHLIQKEVGWMYSLIVLSLEMLSFFIRHL